MNSLIRLVAVVAGLVLMLHSTPSWGQLVNPTVSDRFGNTAGGTDALEFLDTSGGSLGNTAFGDAALQNNTTGNTNTATGDHALGSNTSGTDNTASGFSALVSNTTGDRNTASGSRALANNFTGSNNTAGGYNALGTSTTGSNNTANGANALIFNDGSNNTASGFDALRNNSSGEGNTASGSQALSGNTAGNLNTATGSQALSGNTAGNKNTAIGAQALQQSTGNKNIAIGYAAGVNLTSGSDNIYLSHLGVGAESQTIRIGRAQTRTFIAGIANTSVPNDAVVVIDTVTGQLGTASPSSARYKRDITAMGGRTDGLLQLRPVTFAYRDDVSGLVRYGLIAEEVAAVYPELVTRTPTGDVQGVRYQELIPMLLNELQRQRQEFQQTLQSQQQVLQTQTQALQRQQQELADLRALVGQGREMAASSR